MHQSTVHGDMDSGVGEHHPHPPGLQQHAQVQELAAAPIAHFPLCCWMHQRKQEAIHLRASLIAMLQKIFFLFFFLSFY
jgi:hypothetical protein